MKIIYVLSFLMIIQINYLLSEDIYLKDGSVLKGNIISENATTIVINTSIGIHNITVDNIIKIVNNDRHIVTLKDGRKIEGEIIFQNDQKVILSDESGTEVIDKSNIFSDESATRWYISPNETFDKEVEAKEMVEKQKIKNKEEMKKFKIAYAIWIPFVIYMMVTYL